MNNSIVRRNWWNEPVGLVVIGVLSILAVLVFRYTFSATPAKSAPGDPRIATEVRAELDDLRRQYKAMDNRLRDIEQSISTLRKDMLDLRRPQDGEGPTPPIIATPSVPAPTAQSGVDDTLRSAWAYSASGSFESSTHARILADLITAYEVKGLSPETNASLRSTIQQINEVGVRHVIEEAGKLPRAEAELRLRAYRESTPRLTPTQKQRLSAALANVEALSGIRQ